MRSKFAYYLCWPYNRCIPYRLTEEDKDVDRENRIEVLMISSPNRSDLVFPKVHVLPLISSLRYLAKPHVTFEIPWNEKLISVSSTFLLLSGWMGG